LSLRLIHGDRAASYQRHHVAALTVFVGKLLEDGLSCGIRGGYRLPIRLKLLLSFSERPSLRIAEESLIVCPGDALDMISITVVMCLEVVHCSMTDRVQSGTQ
jgi:hypothetical protein